MKKIKDSMEKRNQCRSLRKSGMSIRQIQAELGMSSPSMVSYYLKPTAHEKSCTKALEALSDIANTVQSLSIKGRPLKNANPNSSPEYIAGAKHMQDWVLERITEKLTETL